MRNEYRASSWSLIVLLIDADKICADLVPLMMQRVEQWGRVIIRRVYGNQAILLSPKWKELCLQYALQPVPHLGLAGAKNATDIALTIEAMDLLWLYQERVTGFCLFTGDQIFLG